MWIVIVGLVLLLPHTSTQFRSKCRSQKVCLEKVCLEVSENS